MVAPADIPWFDPFDVTDGKVYAPDSEGLDYDNTSPWAAVEIGGHRLPGTCMVTGAAVHRIDVQLSNGRDGGTLIERGYEPAKFDVDMKIWTRAHWRIWREVRPTLLRHPGKIGSGDEKVKPSKAQKDAKIAASELTNAQYAYDQTIQRTAPNPQDPQNANDIFAAEKRLEAAKKAAGTAEAALGKEARAAQKRAAFQISNPLLDDAGIHACVVQSITMPRPGPEYGTWIVTIKCREYVGETKTDATRVAVGHVAVPLADQLRDRATSPVNKPKTPLEAGDGGPNGAPAGSGAR